MRKGSRMKKIIISIALTTGILAGTTANAVWWATPGYEWALSNKLTTVKSTSQLKQNVALTDFYSTVLKYLQMNGVTPRDESIYHTDNMDDLDNVAKGIFDIINEYNSRPSLTIQQYYVVENYVNHAQKTLSDYIGYSQYLTRESLKNVDLYLSLSKYRAATLIENRSDREYILGKLGNVKNHEIIYYGMLPYAGDITRREFLVVVYDLMSTNELSEDAIISAFYDAGVLKGFDSGLELDKKLTYSEMLTFLYRFQNFDFEPNADAEDDAE